MGDRNIALLKEFLYILVNRIHKHFAATQRR